MLVCTHAMLYDICLGKSREFSCCTALQQIAHNYAQVKYPLVRVTPLCYSWARNLHVGSCPAAVWCSSSHTEVSSRNLTGFAGQTYFWRGHCYTGIDSQRNKQGVPRSCLLLRAELSVVEKPQKWISVASSTGTIFVPYLQCTSSHKKSREVEENLLLIKAKLMCSVCSVDGSFRGCNIPLRLFLCYF